jgi:hypothetical protein
LQQRQNEIITLVFTVIVAIAIALMGLDIDIRIVLQTMKVCSWKPRARPPSLRNRQSWSLPDLFSVHSY